MMTPKEKLALLKTRLKEEGIYNSWAYLDSPLWQILWALGWKSLHPPIFLSYIKLLLIWGSFFFLVTTIGILLGHALTGWFFQLENRELSIAYLIAMPTINGFVIGISMAFLIRRKSKKLKLPTWDKYGMEEK